MQYPGLLEVITTKFFSGYFILPLWICSILQVGGTVQLYVYGNNQIVQKDVCNGSIDMFCGTGIQQTCCDCKDHKEDCW